MDKPVAADVIMVAADGAAAAGAALLGTAAAPAPVFVADGADAVAYCRNMAAQYKDAPDDDDAKKEAAAARQETVRQSRA